MRSLSILTSGVVLASLIGCGARSELSLPLAPPDAGSDDARGEDAAPGDGARVGIALSRRHICQWSATELDCWGANDAQQLGYATDATCSGNGTTLPCSTVPRAVPGISAPIDVATGDEYTCVIEAGGRITCWGGGYSDPLGSAPASDGRVEVTGIDDPIAIVAGDRHTCVLSGGGTVWCWGDNASGQLGVSLPPGRRGGFVGSASTPQRVPSLVAITSIAAASSTTCALDVAGSAWCWGADQTLLPALEPGGIGIDDPTLFHPTPTLIAMPPARSIVVGTDHACAIGRDSLVRCWGLDIDGASSADVTSAPLCPQREGVSLPCRPTPATIAGLHAVRVAPAFGATCALDTAGSVQCWGAGSYGVLGDDTLLPQDVPTPVLGLPTAAGLVATNLVACALDAAGTVACWGQSDSGQLQGLTRTLDSMPQPIHN